MDLELNVLLVSRPNRMMPLVSNSARLMSLVFQSNRMTPLVSHSDRMMPLVNQSNEMMPLVNHFDRMMPLMNLSRKCAPGISGQAYIETCTKRKPVFYNTWRTKSQCLTSLLQQPFWLSCAWSLECQCTAVDSGTLVHILQCDVCPVWTHDVSCLML